VATCEAELIARAAHGDQEAFRQLWEAHHPAAMAAALRLCHQRALAEEITQGAFLLAWRGLPRFQQGSPFRPWLLRILYRHALDALERQRMHGQWLPLDESRAPASSVAAEGQHTQADPQEEVTQRETVRQALAHLSAEQRRVIALQKTSGKAPEIHPRDEPPCLVGAGRGGPPDRACRVLDNRQHRE